MNFAPVFSIEGLIVAVVFFVFGLFVGANNPVWVSSKWQEVKKTAEKAKAEEGRKQIMADAIAELKRQGLLKE